MSIQPAKLLCATTTAATAAATPLLVWPVSVWQHVLLMPSWAVPILELAHFLELQLLLERPDIVLRRQLVPNNPMWIRGIQVG
jgi:hypothetical protein